MKYGILTFHNIPNIGALLQAYSLCMVIRNMGYDCEIIDYECDNIVKRELCYHPHPNPLKDLVLRLFWHKSKKKLSCAKNICVQNTFTACSHMIKETLLSLIKYMIRLYQDQI